MTTAKASKARKRASGAAKHAGGRPPKPDGERRDTQLGVRGDAETVRRLVALGAKLDQLFPRATLARAALLAGLDAIEREPGLAFDHEPLTETQAYLVLRNHWGGAGKYGEALRDGAEFVVELGFPGATTIDLSDTDSEARSAISYRDALDKLARKVTPKRPLPWTVDP